MTADPVSLEVLVKRTSEGFVTQTVRGKRATSLTSSSRAALRLGKKVFGHEPHTQLVALPITDVAVWRITPSE